MQIKEAILPLVWLVSMLLWSFVAAAVANFIYWCIGSPGQMQGAEGGRIASRYGIWLEKKYAARETAIAKKGRGLNWYKALGMCIYCMCPHVTWILITIAQLAGYGINTGVNKWVNIAFLVLLAPAISNVFLKKIRG